MAKKTEIAIVGAEFLRDFIDRSMRQLNPGVDRPAQKRN